ncbi:MAG: hypothetical protein RJA10_1887 [Pseudomonadota bacterium]
MQTLSRPDTHAAALDAASIHTLPVSGLSIFQRLMAYEGHEVDLLRLCSDPAYAHGCLAAAHTSANEPLRRMAVRLFESHHRNAPLGVH